jgi:hypothetical protein
MNIDDNAPKVKRVLEAGRFFVEWWIVPDKKDYRKKRLKQSFECVRLE